MPTKKVRIYCEQCNSRRTIDKIHQVLVDFGYKEGTPVRLCQRCYEKVSISRLWTPKWTKAKKYPIIKF